MNTIIKYKIRYMASTFPGRVLYLKNRKKLEHTRSEGNTAF